MTEADKTGISKDEGQDIKIRYTYTRDLMAITLEDYEN